MAVFSRGRFLPWPFPQPCALCWGGGYGPATLGLCSGASLCVLPIPEQHHGALRGSGSHLRFCPFFHLLHVNPSPQGPRDRPPLPPRWLCSPRGQVPRLSWPVSVDRGGWMCPKGQSHVRSQPGPRGAEGFAVPGTTCTLALSLSCSPRPSTASGSWGGLVCDTLHTPAGLVLPKAET